MTPRTRSAVTLAAGAETPIQICVREELERYFELLDGEPPNDLYRLVVQQVEAALIQSVMSECDGNRSRAASWLGITRNTLRSKIIAIDENAVHEQE